MGTWTAVIAVGLLGLAGLVAATFWLSKAREAQVEAETKNEVLTKSKELQNAADKIMAEPVAHESSWIERTRKRLSNN